MVDKELIKQKFLKGLSSYNENATIQRQMAQHLSELIPAGNYNRILEIGSYTGFLTQKITDKTEYKDYLAIDLVDSSQYIKGISSKIRFLNADIEEFYTEEKFDLIAANASLQWCDNFEAVIKKLKTMLTDEGIICISTFTENNFKEINDSFNTGLKYLSVDDLAGILPNAEIITEIKTLKFNTPLDLLRHIKLTGVNSTGDTKIGYKEIKNGLNILDVKYQNRLTYSIAYMVEFNNRKTDGDKLHVAYGIKK